MVRLGRSSTPLDLMSYLPEDGQPSMFLLKESPRQSMLTIFNWTEQERTHTVTLASLRLSGTGSYTVDGVFDKNRVSFSESNPLVVAQPAHSVRIFKIINAAVPARVPIVHAQHPSSGKTGETITFSAQLVSSTTPVVSYRWDFGDGVSLTGAQVSHAYTQANTYSVKLMAQGLDGLTAVDSFRLQVMGFISTKFVPAEKQRYRASR